MVRHSKRYASTFGSNIPRAVTVRLQAVTSCFEASKSRALNACTLSLSGPSQLDRFAGGPDFFDITSVALDVILDGIVARVFDVRQMHGRIMFKHDLEMRTDNTVGA